MKDEVRLQRRQAQGFVFQSHSRVRQNTFRGSWKPRPAALFARQLSEESLFIASVHSRQAGSRFDARRVNHAIANRERSSANAAPLPVSVPAIVRRGSTPLLAAFAHI